MKGLLLPSLSGNSAFLRNWRSITVFTKIRHTILSWTSSVLSGSSLPFFFSQEFLYFYIIPRTIICLKGFFTLRFSGQNFIFTSRLSRMQHLFLISPSTSFCEIKTICTAFTASSPKTHFNSYHLRLGLQSDLYPLGSYNFFYANFVPRAFYMSHLLN